ncbi:DUF3899 domain-containing protein [Haploplasma axanthum]|uniref:Uncharacterized protein n=1 Tax=Haploplasma axanthum TaxID=29552 RepID=A0A449BD26_HAPAX|nr:DUF3899 domain-containing protein [Haploplasma axanthum]VEU80322.1 Uncharacterised protein [Haploplasma axanthum]
MKKILKQKWFKYSIIDLIIGFILILLMLIYQNGSSLLHWINAMQVAGIILFSAGWLFFINNEGIFDVAVYGTKYFLKSLVGKRMKHSLYETRVNKKLTPSLVYITLWIHGIVWLLVSLAIYYL